MVGRLGVVLGACIVLGLTPARAASVAIQDFAFAPASVEVDPGETITWTNHDSARHTVTSDAGLFDSGSMGQGATFDLTPTEPGTYGYLCTIHPWMIGEVVVRGAGSPPSAPREIVAEPSLLPGQIEVSWQAPADDGGSPVQSYRLCSGPQPGASDRCLTVAATDVTDQGHTPLQTRYYTVSAINSFGESPPSDQACAMAGPWLAALDC